MNVSIFNHHSNWGGGKKTGTFVTILDLPVPTIQAMRIIIQFKAVQFPSIIVIYAYSFKNPLQNASPIRTTINPFANLKKNI